MNLQRRRKAVAVLHIFFDLEVPELGLCQPVDDFVRLLGPSFEDGTPLRVSQDSTGSMVTSGHKRKRNWKLEALPLLCPSGLPT